MGGSDGRTVLTACIDLATLSTSTARDRLLEPGCTGRREAQHCEPTATRPLRRDT